MSIGKALLRTGSGAMLGAGLKLSDSIEKNRNNPNLDEDTRMTNNFSSALGGATLGAAAAGPGIGYINKGIKSIGKVFSKAASMEVPTDEEKDRMNNEVVDNKTNVSAKNKYKGLIEKEASGEPFKSQQMKLDRLSETLKSKEDKSENMLNETKSIKDHKDYPKFYNVMKKLRDASEIINPNAQLAKLNIGELQAKADFDSSKQQLGHHNRYKGIMINWKNPMEHSIDSDNDNLSHERGWY